MQALIPVQSPLQPPNVEPVEALAVRVTEVDEAKLNAHVEPQLIPAGTLDTVPVPVPVLLTLRLKFVVGGVNPHEYTGEAAFRGVGGLTTKSDVLLSVSVQPVERRISAVMLVRAGAGELSAQLAVP